MNATNKKQQTNKKYVLSRNSTRKKIMAYLNSVAGENRGESFILPMSYTTLAEYLSVDRSAMMRELKKLKAEGIVKSERKTFTLVEYRQN